MRAGALLVAGLLSACASEPRAPRFSEADYPGQLRPPSALGADVLWQQRVTASWGDEKGRSFDVAVQKRGDTLTSIARLFSTSVSALKQWNRLRSNRISPGQRLTVYTSSN